MEIMFYRLMSAIADRVVPTIAQLQTKFIHRIFRLLKI